MVVRGWPLMPMFSEMVVSLLPRISPFWKKRLIHS
jgi:hypothetical protein